MKHIPISIIRILLPCIALGACSNDDNDEPQVVDRDLSFAAQIGEIAQGHTWNCASPATLNIVAQHPGARVEVYSHWNGRTFRLAETTTASSTQVMRFDTAPGMDEFTVLVDGIAYTARSGQEIRAVGTSARPEWADKAEPLGWLLAADLDYDFDFNDVVARFVPQPDGGVSVTGMAGGIGGLFWLHYTDGATDYILSPLLHDGMLETNIIDTWTAPEYVWHSFFGDEENPTLYCGWRVNTMATGGANHYAGRTVTVPGSLFGTSPFLPSYLCMAEGKGETLRAISGFYITQGMFDVNRPVEDKDTEQAVYATLPSGSVPYFLVIPDICADPLDERVASWQWPTEMSRIDLVYPLFKNWASDPSVVWSQSRPEGWANRTGYTDDAGSYLYFGYYRR